ncbi:hypothetical protein OSH11_21305 [Kaistia dalseonensis]|uniref:Methylamine utilization protein MauE n=1 Tax=Kaistia dalseonensis TaxID=410840 RepID=A0ABU0HC45_9HYPH|nr:MauE/DoxX family redox-associated membrane protein [Kaistia dalseonensis]MCX5497251.1 hypothetical protein [Kaistia dalseonensis]MDQ0439883.1 hypothetical protein [Kaistia dalseonensis]
MESSFLSLVSAAITVFIALIFVRSALHKAGAFTEFTGFVADYQIVGERLVQPVSMGIVGAEILVVALQLIPGGQVPGLMLAAGLLALYAAAMAVNIWRGRTHIECGCGGAVQPLAWALVMRNGALVLLAGLAAATGPLSLDVAGTATAIACGFAAWVAFLLAEQILANSSLARLTR